MARRCRKKVRVKDGRSTQWPKGTVVRVCTDKLQQMIKLVRRYDSMRLPQDNLGVSAITFSSFYSLLTKLDGQPHVQKRLRRRRPVSIPSNHLYTVGSKICNFHFFFYLKSLKIDLPRQYEGSKLLVMIFRVGMLQKSLQNMPWSPFLTAFNSRKHFFVKNHA